MPCSHYKRKLISLYFDRLTNYYNRNFLEDYRKYLNEKAELEPFFVIMADLKGLKQINLTYGHATGDRYIQTKSEKALYIIQKTLKIPYVIKNFDLKNSTDVQILMSSDLYPIRYGGDEFLYIVYNKKPDLNALLNLKIKLTNNNFHAAYYIPEESESLDKAIAKVGLKVKNTKL